MAKLQISLTGKYYSDERKQEMWLDIHHREKCPECGAIGSMLKGPRGGEAINIKCSECGTIFWTTPCEGFGAYPIDRELKL